MHPLIQINDNIGSGYLDGSITIWDAIAGSLIATMQGQYQTRLIQLILVLMASILFLVRMIIPSSFGMPVQVNY